ncbi:P-type conjugative transfer protein TrbG [Salmonella enterica subsp. enterica serovar Virchow]|nr:P-type conjugative transfer protein TrbG [Proteus mirabilis]ECS2986255.1 P-type conjugative transfer protein TrbG [Salmonella enterica subsp. enterica serovar Reading]EDB3234689.1 P-type conjugative transfer protein TrbG [Salmonella enterica subsp. enterica serovar Virchow]EKC8290670.1 P-type conjugative transfer protein TrbG [Escherichia coli]ECU6114011.1 P-type conjugative transfer protein TrbG [Salmonella enterica subsp. enterica serovar Reading]MCL8564341.1 P-type conjugative transfer p
MNNQKWVVCALVAALSAPVFAQTTVPALSQEALPPIPLVSGQQIKLDSKEAYGIKLANEWKNHPDRPRRGDDGSVKYLFGATLPTLVCTPLQVCSIRLQAGEVVNDVHAGDAVRWKITPATEGVGPTATTVVVVKPTDAGLTTNLIITTDRRIYTVKLASTQREWIPVLSFDYPDDVQREWAAYAQRQAQTIHANTLPTGQNLANLDFNFRMSGDSPAWKPIRIYTDGVKTYIQFPSSHFNEAPALVALGQRGGEELVNYRLIGDRYVVDKVLDRAALIVGVGRSQTKVEISRTGGR